MIAIIDYDAGNIKSVEKALRAIGRESVVTRDHREILGADHVILPGVGAFGDAMDKLRQYGLVSVIREVADRKTPFLGICLGLQLLFEGSEESGGVEGLHILDGQILRIPDGDGLKIPHIGWNSLEFPKAAASVRTDSHEGGVTPSNEGYFSSNEGVLSSNEGVFSSDEGVFSSNEGEGAYSPKGRLFRGIEGEPYVYFVHSYYLKARDESIVRATTEYGVHIHASVESGNVFACQFHPEKSSSVGLRMLENFGNSSPEG